MVSEMGFEWPYKSIVLNSIVFRSIVFRICRKQHEASLCVLPSSFFSKRHVQMVQPDTSTVLFLLIGVNKIIIIIIIITVSLIVL